MSENFVDFIEEKGRDTISSVLAVETATVRSWVHLRRIPRKHWPDLLGEFDDLSMGALRRMEEAADVQPR